MLNISKAIIALLLVGENLCIVCTYTFCFIVLENTDVGTLSLKSRSGQKSILYFLHHE